MIAALLDFTEVGEIGNYIDEAYVAQCEHEFADGGLVSGSQIAGGFASLRPDELVWSFFVENYLKGSSPRAFDLLHWNSDSTRMPACMHAFYLRNMYIRNALRTPGGITLGGCSITSGTPPWIVPRACSAQM